MPGEKIIRDRELPRIRVTADELAQIKARAQEADLTQSEYIRQICANGKITKIDSKLEFETVRQLLAIGRNLNQITKSGHIRSGVDMAELRKTLTALQQVVSELLP